MMCRGSREPPSTGRLARARMSAAIAVACSGGRFASALGSSDGTEPFAGPPSSPTTRETASSTSRRPRPIGSIRSSTSPWAWSLMPSCVSSRTGRADQLHTHLGELAEPGSRRSLIPEAGASVVKPQRQAVALQVAQEGPHHAGGQLRPQTQAAVPVREGVHAGDDLLARLAQEQLERLDDRRLDALVAERLEAGPQLGLEAAQAGIGG